MHSRDAYSQVLALLLQGAHLGELVAPAIEHFVSRKFSSGRHQEEKRNFMTWGVNIG